MIRARRSELSRTLRAVAPLVGLTAAAFVLLRFPPGLNTFYPQCPIYSALHLLCPGCGETRALAALLHGQVGEALRFNALVTLVLPFAGGYGVVVYWRWLRGEALRWPHLPRVAVYVGLLVAAVFTVQRNLPLH